MLSFSFALLKKDCNHAALRIPLRKMWPLRDPSKVLGRSACRLSHVRGIRRTIDIGAGFPVQGKRVLHNRLRSGWRERIGIERCRSQRVRLEVVGDCGWFHPFQGSVHANVG